MIVVLVETTPSGAAVEVSREALTFARGAGGEGGGVPVDAVVVGEPSADARSRRWRPTASGTCTR